MRTKETAGLSQFGANVWLRLTGSNVSEYYSLEL